MKIHVYNEQQDVALRVTSVKPVVQDVLESEEISTDELSIYFVTQDEICRLHQEFFNDPSPTDCITLPLDESDEDASGYHILGEIFICPKAAVDYQKTPVVQELTLYLVHGLLHLIGYEDLKLSDIKKMRAAEARHMERLIAKKLLLKLGKKS